MHIVHWISSATRQGIKAEKDRLLGKKFPSELQKELVRGNCEWQALSWKAQQKKCVCGGAWGEF